MGCQTNRPIPLADDLFDGLGHVFRPHWRGRWPSVDFVVGQCRTDLGSARVDVANEILSGFVDGGKCVRSTFMYLGWLCGADEDPAALRASASLELLHAFALMQDDVMDGSPLRRSRPAAHVVFAGWHRDRAMAGSSERFGESAAILLGDLCLVWAEEMLRRSGVGEHALSRVWPRYDAMRTELAIGQFHASQQVVVLKGQELSGHTILTLSNLNDGKGTADGKSVRILPGATGTNAFYQVVSVHFDGCFFWFIHFRQNLPSLRCAQMHASDVRHRLDVLMRGGPGRGARWTTHCWVKTCGRLLAWRAATCCATGAIGGGTGREPGGNAGGWRGSGETDPSATLFSRCRKGRPSDSTGGSSVGQSACPPGLADRSNGSSC